MGVEEDIINFIDKLNASESAIHFTQKPTMDTVGKPLPSPRSWMLVDKILKLGITSKQTLLDMIKGALGDETAVKFMQTRKKLDDVVSVNQIVSDFDGIKIRLDKQNSGTMHKTVTDFAELLTQKSVSYSDDELLNIAKFTDYICENQKPLASLLYQKVTNIDDLKGTVYSNAIKIYKQTNGVNLLARLMAIGKTLK
jgi:hypothetical protein